VKLLSFGLLLSDAFMGLITKSSFKMQSSEKLGEALLAKQSAAILFGVMAWRWMVNNS
jgi:hypothetical protein